MVDSVPDGSVPLGDQGLDQDAAAGEKKLVTPGQFRTLEGTGMDMSGYQVAPADPDASPEEGSKPGTDGTLEDEGGATTPPADSIAADAAPEGVTPPPGDTPKAGDAEWDITPLGSVTTRKHKESGIIEFKVKIDGEERWVSDEVFQRGYQRNTSNQEASEKLASERRAFQKEQESATSFQEMLNGYKKPTPAPAAGSEFDDILDPDAPPAPAADAPQGEVLKAINALSDENKSLRKELGLSPEQKAEADRVRQINVAMESSWAEVKAYCTEAGIPLPADKDGNPSDAFVARVEAIAETEKVEPGIIMTSPARAIGAAKSLYKKATPPKPSADSTETPPTAATPQRGDPGLGELQKATKEQETLKKKAREPGVDDRDAAVKTIRNMRRRKALAEK